MLNKKIASGNKLKTILAKLKRKNKTVVFTNGCFDILHRGHIEYLNKAKSFGDVLVVGCNSDVSVRRIKGRKRPINRQSDRAKVLSMLECVNFISIFNEDTPLNLIEYVKPDILVKGADWKKKDVVGGDFVESYGGKVKTIKYLKGYSTTEILKKIKRL